MTLFEQLTDGCVADRLEVGRYNADPPVEYRCADLRDYVLVLGVALGIAAAIVGLLMHGKKK